MQKFTLGKFGMSTKELQEGWDCGWQQAGRSSGHQRR